MNNKSKIALFLPSLRGGGAERMMVHLARGFVERGLNVDIVLAKAEGPYLSLVPSEVRIIDLKASRVLLAFPGLVRFLRKERPVVLLSTLDHANIVALLAKLLSKVSTRVVIRLAGTISTGLRNSFSIKKILSFYLLKYCNSWFDGIIAVSNGVANDYAEATGIARERIKVIYNPVVTPELFLQSEEPVKHPWFTDGSPPVILGVGRLTVQKDFTTLIKAFSIVRKHRLTRLIILGEGEQRTKLEALVQELGLKDDVSMPGFVDNPFSYMSNASVFVLSSLWEGLPNVLIQAMACGCPVVSTDCPSGPAEILENGKWGKLVPVGDAEALAVAVENILDESNLPDVIQRAKDFALYKAVDRYLELLLIEDK